LDIAPILQGTPNASQNSVRCTEPQDHEMDGLIDYTLIEKATPALESRMPVEIETCITNQDRAVCTMLSGKIAEKYGLEGLAEDTIVCCFKGSAGQSFAAFGAHGITAILEGESNDYLCKGLSGAKVIVKPPKGTTFDPAENILAGNVLLYGATSGELYINGRVGERFAIRNSGAKAVVEGVGDHGCEYMTGGCVVILGDTGVNFGAGMSGGIAYIYDPHAQFDDRCNLSMIDLDLVEDPEDIAVLQSMLEKHVEYTGSKKAKQILDRFEDALPRFVKVFPMEYRRALGKMMKEDEDVQREVPDHK
jgi:glutamate synthase domain-containing protein 3